MFRNKTTPRKKKNPKSQCGASFGFSFVELIVIIAILAVLAALLAPSLMQYTERSRAQKDETTMDEVVNAVQLAMANSDCYDEAIKYSCSNNYVTYTDSSGNYGQVLADGEYWAPDGSGKATTITFNPETDANGNTIYKLKNGIINDMTYGNGSVAQDRIMEDAQIENNQCYLNNTTYLYNMIRQSVGNDIVTSSSTYKNSSFTIFICFNQKDNVKVADISGSFNGTNLTVDSQASKGSGTLTYDPSTGDAIQTEQNPGKTEANFTQSDLSGNGTLNAIPDYKQPAVDAGILIPNGGIYETSDGEIFMAGDEYPEFSEGDIFKDEYYEYRYNQQGAVGINFDFGMQYFFEWLEDETMDGWGVRVLNDSLTEYGEIRTTINGKPVVNINATFYNCKNMRKAPNIPQGITILEYTFGNCTSLQDNGMPSLPDSIVTLSHTFENCDNLKDLRSFHIPEGVTIMDCAFHKCSFLQYAPTIPSTVTSMRHTFNECSRLTSIGEIPNGMLDMTYAFSNCNNLRIAPIIPATVTKIERLFAGCYSLETYVGSTSEKGDFSQYQMPPNVRYWSGVFEGCRYITHSPQMHEGIYDIMSCFKNSGLVVAPQLPSTIKDIRFAFENCQYLTTAPSIPANVRYVDQAFYNCTKLTGEIVVNSSVISSYNKFLYGTKLSIVLRGSSNKLSTLANTANNGNVTIG